MYNAVIEVPFGKVGIRIADGVLKQILYLPEQTPELAPDSALAKRAVKQIESYLAHAVSPFDLPIETVGTAFQQRVWQAISEIPCGTVLTYGQVARRIGSAPRAVTMLLRCSAPAVKLSLMESPKSPDDRRWALAV